MVRWVCEEIGLPKRYTKEIIFKYLPANSKSPWAGFSQVFEKRVSISLAQNNTYPQHDTHFGISVSLFDDIDVLVDVVAHELQHQYQDHTGYTWRNRKGCERNATYTEKKVVRKFQENRDDLIKEWGYESDVVIVGSRSGKIMAYGSKGWYDQTLLELIDIHISTGGDPDITVDELIKYYKGLTILR